MKTLRVTIDFDQNRTIGTLDIDETKLPKGDTYCFAIGGRKHDPQYGDFELMEISLVTDENYLKYLKSIYE
jgi:hypothetical protein